MNNETAKTFRKLNNKITELSKAIQSLETEISNLIKQVDFLTQELKNQRPIIIREPTYPTTPTIPLGPYFDNPKPYKPFYGPIMSNSDTTNNIKPC